MTDRDIIEKNIKEYHKIMSISMDMGTIIDGKAVVEAEIEKLKQRVKRGTKAVVIQVGDNPASSVYVRNKLKMCSELGIEGNLIHLPKETPERALLKLIESYNSDSKIHGILVQLPLPEHLNAEVIAEAIDSRKDIDSFKSYNLGEVVKGNEIISPCTPKGIFTLLKNYGLSVRGKTVVVVGRSNIVGKPLVNMLINRGATVISCNSITPIDKIIDYMFNCDIFISAIGKPKYFNLNLLRKYRGEDFDYICPVMIDVGINRDENNKLCGDIDIEVGPYVNYITPVPGGVGKTTVLELMRNIINCRDIVSK